ncbi:succinyl-diaminopimelate desuccinylase [Terricaulis silvestris]|uniref:Succinyl-diaminopimelate desuccinylase n=1 Tax=Terricaulis silvestris TaxID=2686094 RepID=A0A6I6MKD9_9CAUL|nr:succinyl-diaminopimelate desuccinylase [Terricaulis silvestris]QGZ94431.1 Succinyl-diaminopimelate desuccinylase [Terricaulis silvestris]
MADTIADPIPLAQALMRRPSITPAEAGVMDIAEQALTKLGFRTKRYRFGVVENLYARLGNAAPNFCFAGHLDVVPPGEGWTSDPFAADIRDGVLYGRGATDMKTAIAAMIAGTENFLRQGAPRGSISFLLTCDEEGPAIDGTKRVLEALAEEGEKIDHCIVGEPTSETSVGDMIKNGRRGSLNVAITMDGKQGHVAYPHRAANPVTPLLQTLAALKARKLDDGAPGFDASNLEVTSIDVGNPAHNVIPQKAAAKLNIRFNTNHTAETLLAWIDETAKANADRAGVSYARVIPSQSLAFYTDPGPFTDLIVASVEEAFGIRPVLATTGGTSDARFIRLYCPVAELGLRNETAHMVDENCAVDDVRALARCYEAVLRRYFA